MTLVFRAISRAKWYPEKSPSWLAEDDLQADILTDLRTSGNTLSFYIIEDDETNLQRVIVAFAAARQALSNLDYILLDQTMLDDMGFKFASTKGITPDDTVNSWHQDMIELSLKKLTILANAIRFKPIQSKRESHKRLKNWMVEGISAGHLNQSQMHTKLLEELGL